MLERLRALSRQEVRSLDEQAARELSLPTLVLMENAGRGAAALLAERTGKASVPPRVLILCGPGNNGGDGGVVARHLDAWGFHVRVVWFAHREKLRGDADIQWTILERSGIAQTSWYETEAGEAATKQGTEPGPAALDALLTGADWLIDGLLGTGLTRPVEGVLRQVIEAINRAGKPVLALDLPSGLDCDSGQPLGVAVRATATATFVAPKRGFEAPGAGAYTGEVAVVDIGLPRRLLAPFVVGSCPESEVR
jgi:NAD(P)H-hydrate epimerase